MASYEETKRDFEYLNKIAPGGDMMEIDASVFDLMANPTKKRAKELYLTAIGCWFRAIGKDMSFAGVPESVLDNPSVIVILEKYGHHIEQNEK